MLKDAPYTEPESFGLRLAKLREELGISARQMSLELGQNESYINRIENGKIYPSLQVFFYICDYLHVTPKEFFDEDLPEPPLTAGQLITKIRELPSPLVVILAQLVEHLK